jgi:hypothetical protein
VSIYLPNTVYVYSSFRYLSDLLRDRSGHIGVNWCSWPYLGLSLPEKALQELLGLYRASPQHIRAYTGIYGHIRAYTDHVFGMAYKAIVELAQG